MRPSSILMYVKTSPGSEAGASLQQGDKVQIVLWFVCMKLADYWDWRGEGERRWITNAIFAAQSFKCRRFEYSKSGYADPRPSCWHICTWKKIFCRQVVQTQTLPLCKRRQVVVRQVVRSLRRLIIFGLIIWLHQTQSGYMQMYTSMKRKYLFRTVAWSEKIMCIRDHKYILSWLGSGSGSRWLKWTI